MSVGLLVLSHSNLAATGIADIARQMSGGDVKIVAVGGNDSGGLGASVPAVVEALEAILGECDSAVIIPDLGSAVLSAKSAMEFIGDNAARVYIADAPILEGSMLAAIEASIGSDASRVAAVAEESRQLKKLER